MRAKLAFAAVGYLAILSTVVGCASPSVESSFGAGGEGPDSTSAAAGSGGAATDSTGTDGGVGEAAEPISSVPGSPVGVGKLGVTGPLMQVTKLEAGIAIPQAFKIAPVGADTVALVSSTIDLLELQYDVSSWPPQQRLRRSIDSHQATRFDLTDNGDFTYALVSQVEIPGKYLVSDRIAKDDSVKMQVAMAAAKTSASSSFAMAHRGSESFWAFDVGTAEGKGFFLGRQQNAAIQVIEAPVLSAPSPEPFLIGAIALADRFLVALEGGDATSARSASDDQAAEMISIVSQGPAGRFAPEVTATFDVGARASGAILKPRDDGAWLAIALPDQLELLAVDADGAIVGGPTTIPAKIGKQSGLPAFDAIATEEGLFVTWFSNTTSKVTIEAARFDERGVLVERASIPADPSRPFASSFSMAKHRDRYAVFLGLAPKAGDVGLVFAAEISDAY